MIILMSSITQTQPLLAVAQYLFVTYRRFFLQKLLTLPDPPTS
jgi:hypothetical protein